MIWFHRKYFFSFYKMHAEYLEVKCNNIFNTLWKVWQKSGIVCVCVSVSMHVCVDRKKGW